MGVIDKLKDKIAKAGMLHPDMPWNGEMPQRVVDGRRMQRVQSDAVETQRSGTCPNCGGPATIESIWITRRYGGENGPIYDRWKAQEVVYCPHCRTEHSSGAIFRRQLTDDEIDKTYERRE